MGVFFYISGKVLCKSRVYEGCCGGDLDGPVSGVASRHDRVVAALVLDGFSEDVARVFKDVHYVRVFGVIVLVVAGVLVLPLVLFEQEEDARGFPFCWLKNKLLLLCGIALFLRPQIPFWWARMSHLRLS